VWLRGFCGVATRLARRLVWSLQLMVALLEDGVCFVYSAL
jgi:hypothetical protein